MNVPVKIFKILASMADHRFRKRGHGFRRNLDRPGSTEFVVRRHQRIIRRFRRFAQTFLLLDEADIAAALEPSSLDFLEIFGGGA